MNDGGLVMRREAAVDMKEDHLLRDLSWLQATENCQSETTDGKSQD